MSSELRLANGRVVELAKKTEFLRNPEEVDGEVIAASVDLGLCWIDLGRDDLLRRGTRFKVHRTGKGGVRRPMGIIEVRSLKDDRAECGIVENYNSTDPIGPGDKIVAPLYDKEMPREFVLVGRFPAGYPRDLVADRLQSLGASVADKVTATTDFLVLGDEENIDPDAEEVDDPMGEQVALASRYQVQTLPVRELLDFLRYD